MIPVRKAESVGTTDADYGHADGYIDFGYSDRSRIEQLRKQSKGRLRVVDDQSAYLPIAQKVREPEAIFAAVKSLLRRD